MEENTSISLSHVGMNVTISDDEQCVTAIDIIEKLMAPAMIAVGFAPQSVYDAMYEVGDMHGADNEPG